MGLKFPSGDINEPGRGARLPPAFQTGSGAYDIVPGIRWQASRKLSAQLRFAIPVHEDWNGRSSSSVGQVAPDVTTMFTLSYNFG